MKSMKETKENAVSPVVGIMLMLVVTIIIAAVVALFASGITTGTEASSNAIIKLDNYVMGTADTTDGTIEYGVFNKTKVPQFGNTAEYSIYNITFFHQGGGALDTKDLKLAITFNGATYSASFSEFLDENIDHFIAGDIITLRADTTFAYGNGISQQNMGGDKYSGSYVRPPVETFDWAIIDASGNTISSGVENSIRLPDTYGL